MGREDDRQLVQAFVADFAVFLERTEGEDELRQLAADRDEAGVQMFVARERLHHCLIPGYCTG